ncbi:MAG TPA: hypothetical protein VII06_32205 [Chloroflexota bacterium]|jgi:hypothetical protein
MRPDPSTALRAPARIPRRFKARAITRRLLPWLPIAALVGLWLVWVGREVPYFYGEFGDDYFQFFRMGLGTVHDWREAFGRWHIYPLYFFLISYLPLKLHLAIPGAVLPDYSHESIALYRGLIAYVVGLHALILVLFGQFVFTMTHRRLTAFLATLLLAVNPLFLWMATTPESRSIGLLLALPAMTLLFAIDWQRNSAARPRLPALFAAGALLTISYLVQYTDLYLVVPFIGAYWLVCLFSGPPLRLLLVRLSAFAAGLLAPQLLVEFISTVVLHNPNTLANLSTVIRSNQALAGTGVTYGAKSQEWLTSYATDTGWPILIVSLLGAVVLARPRRGWPRYATARHAWTILLTAAVGVGLPFATLYVPYRSQAIVQPVLFSLTAVGLTALYDAAATFWGRVAKRRASAGRLPSAARVAPALLAAGACLLTLWLPLRQSTAFTLPRRANLGRILAANPQPMVFTLEAGNVVQQDVFDRQGTGISPAQVLDMDPSIAVYDCGVYGCVHWPDRGRFLRVESVTTDSSLQTSAGHYDADRALDGGISHDGVTDWVSAAGDGSHWLELRFAEPYPLEELVIANRRQAIRPEIVNVYGLVDDAWTQLYRGAGLSRSPVVHARWAKKTVSGIRIEIAASSLEGQRVPQAEIDELYFPGYRALVGPDEQRPTLEPLEILAVDADSSARDSWGRWYPEHVFEYQMGRTDGYSAWQSENTPGPHYLQVQLARPYVLDNVQVVNALQSQLATGYATRIREMEVWLYGADGWARVWEGQNLDSQVVVGASWPPTVASAVAIVVKQSATRGIPVGFSLVQEVVFPGYFAVFDGPASKAGA